VPPGEHGVAVPLASRQPLRQGSDAALDASTSTYQATVRDARSRDRAPLAAARIHCTALLGSITSPRPFAQGLGRRFLCVAGLFQWAPSLVCEQQLSPAAGARPGLQRLAAGSREDDVRTSDGPRTLHVEV